MGNLRSLGCFRRLREEDKSDRKNQEHRNDESLEGSHCVNEQWVRVGFLFSIPPVIMKRTKCPLALIRAYFFPHT